MSEIDDQFSGTKQVADALAFDEGAQPGKIVDAVQGASSDCPFLTGAAASLNQYQSIN
ncbi:MAG: hypothetical protein NXI03_08900 [Alphaproteobacteria bacterium]|nr:hypothetical protein [Alphaproteobacteria bacterium]